MGNAKKKCGILSFFEKKGVTLSPKVYFVDAMGSMALGLFASLLIGTIFNALGRADVLDLEFFRQISKFASSAAGAAIGVAIAYTLKAPPLVLFSAATVGFAGYSAGMAGTNLTAGPAGAFVAVLIATELGKLVSKETKVDILITPAVTLVSGVGVALLVGPWVGYGMYWLGQLINTATTLQPLLMGVVVSVLVGIALTLPISSAAICAMLGMAGLAGGAATAGCCAQMIGFAVISFRENKWEGLVAQGLGTSMLQMGNIVKKPLIWIPATLASAITGPVATCVFGLANTGVNAGMGTCGMVGPIGVVTTMAADPANNTAFMWAGILVVCILLPALLSIIFSEVMRKLGWIKYGDLKLEL
ncbi:MAG: PTS sugar transporter subunit IIC [Clostridia bacterium]|nr:PTS sugar transporter subunit IIC [Clostridia bacterium]